MTRKSIMVTGFTMLFILGSILVFYWILNDTKSVYTYAYGHDTTFELGKVEDVSEVDVYNSTFMDEHVTFKVADKEAFLESYVLDHENYVTSYELFTRSGGYFRTFYLFEHDRQLFRLYYSDNLDIFRMEHVGALVKDIHLYIPFPVYEYYNHDEPDFTEPIAWSDVSWTPWESFGDAAAFYELLSDYQADIDYDQKTIDLNAMIVRFHEFEGFTEDYPVTLRFTDEGFIIEHEDLPD